MTSSTLARNAFPTLAFPHVLRPTALDYWVDDARLTWLYWCDQVTSGRERLPAVQRALINATRIEKVVDAQTGIPFYQQKCHF